MNANRVLLVSPLVYRSRSYPNVGLGYVGAHLARYGIDVRIVDTNFTGEDPYAALRESDALVVGIACESRNVLEALELAKFAKGLGHVTVLGGLHVTLIKGEILDSAGVDFAIHGEGEQPMLELVHALREGRSHEGIAGLIHRRASEPAGEVVVEPAVNVPDLDDLDFPRYELAGVSEIYEYPLITSRDCPYDCNFCTVGTISGRSWRQRRPEHLVEELLEARRRYGIKRFFVADEMFSLNMERVKTFCRLLIKKKNNMEWSVMEGLRADRVDAELLQLMKQSGCRWVIYGIESVDEDVFANISKGERLSKIDKAVQLAKSEGMRVGGYFVIGLPESTFERDMRSIRYVKEMGMDYAAFWMANPYYGTPLYQWVKDNAVILREPIGDNIVNSLSTMPLFETQQYPGRLVKKAHAICNLRMGYRSFYDEPLPTGLRNRLRHHLRFWGMILRYDARNAFAYLRPSSTRRPRVPGWRGWMVNRRLGMRKGRPGERKEPMLTTTQAE
ncbi:MAG: B12-binding domain-containing radical SAM protein [bacterium]|nr:B12-binding domain-containing radical SAM protein [bacterium]